MVRPANSQRAAWLLGALLSVQPLRAEPVEESERWVPSIAVTSELLGQRADGNVESGPITWNRTSRFRSPFFPFNAVVETTTVTNASLRPAAEGNDLLLAPVIGGQAELMTPGLQRVPGRPRFFVHGGAGAAFASTNHIARERAPADLPDPMPTDPYFGEDSVDGVGSEITAEVQPFVVSAGAGIAWSLDLWGRRVRIKPSVEYFREEIDFEGRVNRALEIDTGINFFPAVPPIAPEIPTVPTTLLPIELAGSTSEDFQGVGPGIELELDVRRVGPFVLALGISAQAYKILGDREVEFSSELTLDNPALVPNPQTVTADWSYEAEPWAYRGGVNLRFRWLPE